MNVEEQTEEAERERVKGFERTKRILSYHIYRLHRKAKRYSENAKDEEKYYRALKSLGYLSQVLIAAHRSAFDEELSIVEEAMKKADKIRAEYYRLKRLEAEYVRVTTATSAGGSAET